jgi:hypothetical protein
MKKALLVVAAIALVVWVISWFRNDKAVATSAAQTWPGGMGTLDSVIARFPPRQANAASARLAALGKTLPRSDAVDTFVWREIARGELAVGHAPALPDVSAIREILLREPVVWERSYRGIGDQETISRRAMQMTVAKVLVADALAKAGARDSSAWDDLRAAWNLARSLDGQPEVMSQTAALTMERMINATAWKAPLPAPAWLGELQQRDAVRPLLEAFQYQAASYWKSGARVFPTKWLADSVERDRHLAEVLFKETRCDVNAPMNDLGVDLSAVWLRAFRYRAEREAAANALRVREGHPIETKSVCSDGTWSFDGTTLRFSRDIRSTEGDKAMPLALRVKP